MPALFAAGAVEPAQACGRFASSIGERRDAGTGARETHQAQTSILERVRDEDERRRSREHTNVAAQLIRLRSGHVPVEPNARRPVCALFRIPRCVHFLARGSEELRNDVVLARVSLNLRDVHADARGHRQRSTRPLILRVQARHGRIERGRDIVVVAAVRISDGVAGWLERVQRGDVRENPDAAETLWEVVVDLGVLVTTAERDGVRAERNRHVVLELENVLVRAVSDGELLRSERDRGGRVQRGGAGRADGNDADGHLRRDRRHLSEIANRVEPADRLVRDAREEVGIQLRRPSSCSC